MWLALPALLAAAAVGLPVATSVGQSPSQYVQTNLVSDIPGVARITDPNLVNPWGQSEVGSSPLWVADNGTNRSTLYTGGVNGSAPSIVPLVVKIQGGAPTGTVGNPTNSMSDFLVTTGAGTAPATFMFVSETGHLTAWSHAVSGTVAQSVAFVPHAVYKGLELASIGSSHFLYATNFHDARIDVFDGNFHLVKFGTGSFGPQAFQDPHLPSGYAPFNIELINGNLYVSYAKQNAEKHDDVAGLGHGFVDVWNTAGVLQTRLINRGVLNSPWGMALAPASFGGFAGDLLVGNFGDGLIHAYNPTTGDMVGTLTNTDGNPITINGLWALRFGNGTFGAPTALVFTAGIADESHGLLGEITPAP
jgi:uncharacterized protein (TIGR03118 family)